jgi:16S rRNA A1518/A1519 N6-dimethyltransferase RsmA/KsgA/DIM1 with predicted DNA glycosylase/AP lyase activity
MLVIEIILVVCALMAAISIVLMTMKTGISPSPSSGRASRAIVAAAENSGTGPIVDLGSGWGTLVAALARNYPNRQVAGYELSFVPWLFSSIRKSFSGLDNLTLYRKDFLNADLSDVAVLTSYLFPGGMAALKDKLERDNITEVLIVSSTFALPSSNPVKVIRVKDFYGTTVYLYRL